MRARIVDDVLFLHREDVPQFQRGGPIVRNTFFWALRSIAGRATTSKDWEFESEVWLALARMLLSFGESGYLGLRETTLEFSTEETGMIPEVLRSVSSFS
ncbi:hypothetical protein [Leptolyngbya sp. FACHB-261]|uniref:hypothetical protein n=1 Tax=Leptolyngbya sp. FACHB-261 TaxID=2692806 RepID=UPI001682539C|nr:hypothetical protein [Leptolyngbya sp. FACHB-261]MBD2101992.1 hypothetical protein [Leptolyngbya sp. FACHB-261]